MTTRQTKPAATPVTAYLDAASEPARARLRTLATVIRTEAPEAVERLAYGLATWHQGENLIHIGAFANHVGVYPGSAAIVAFAAERTGFKTSKGAIQIPHDGPLPTELVRRIARWRVQQAQARPATAAAKRSTAARPPRATSDLADDVAAYNAAQSETDRATCAALAERISTALPDGACKVWHGHPVWFLAGNPVVGYSTHRGGIRLLFWSGQSFDEAGLAPVGKFKAAEACYATAADIAPKKLDRWLKKATTIQWDYKNIVRNKGVLERLE